MDMALCVLGKPKAWNMVLGTLAEVSVAGYWLSMVLVVSKAFWKPRADGARGGLGSDFAAI